MFESILSYLKNTIAKFVREADKIINKQTMVTVLTAKSEDSTMRDGLTPKLDTSQGKDVPFIHRFISNWLITDPGLYDQPATKYYQVNYDLKTVFLFGGRWRTLKVFPLHVISFVFVLLPGILYCIFTFLLNYALGAVFLYCWILAIYNMIRAAVSNPGIVPRNVHAPLAANSVEVNSPEEYFNTIEMPAYRLKTGVGIKYCPTCHIWKPPRTSHCSKCNVCVNNLDHHCIFLNNCIGYRNYQNFLWFILMAVFAIVLYLVGVITQYLDLGNHPVNIFLIVYGGCSIMYPLLLLGFHFYATAQNLSTREYLNFVQGKNGFVNVYRGSIWKNLMINWISRPKGLVLLKAKDEIADDDRVKRMEPLTKYEV